MLDPKNLPLPPTHLLDDAGLFLDFDGTLVELADRPDAVSVEATLPLLLARLGARLDGRVALVSGRSIEQLEGFFGDHAAAMALVGSHGAERRMVGGAISGPDRPALLIDAERRFAAAFADRPDVVIEVKSLGVAIHYRQLPEAEGEAHALVESFAGDGLEVQKGKMMAELRMSGHDKGTAIAALAAMPPFAGHPPVFIGDDLTDEPGFVAARAAGGSGILVGAPRATAATYRLDDVASVARWLEDAA